ncbi:MAG: hypothetical protein COA36_06005 [Desulfotalea sp.]|nr:MAG: hypothetical protein COA36_06005 [Desulfotalea sp.]
MKKTYVKGLIAAAIGSLMIVGSASASRLPELSKNFAWNNADYWSVSDLSKGQATFQLTWENPDATYESSFGLYSLENNPILSPKVSKTFEVFGAFDEPTKAPTTANSASAWFRLTNGMWQVSQTEGGVYKDFGNVFGFYSDVYTGVKGTKISYTWYTDSQFNSDGEEHFAIAYNKTTHDTAIYLEDREGGLKSGGEDNVDLMVTGSDLDPVPEPNTMLLFGTGLIGLAGVARRKKAKK